MAKLHSCDCGGFKFVVGWARIRCAVCGKQQPGKWYKDYFPADPKVMQVPPMCKFDTPDKPTPEPLCPS